jgi:chromate reductase
MGKKIVIKGSRVGLVEDSMYRGNDTVTYSPVKNPKSKRDQNFPTMIGTYEGTFLDKHRITNVLGGKAGYTIHSKGGGRELQYGISEDAADYFLAKKGVINPRDLIGKNINLRVKSKDGGAHDIEGIVLDDENEEEEVLVKKKRNKKLKIIAFAGSMRKESFNKKLVNYAALLLKDRGVNVEVVDLKELQIPVYDGDFEEKKGMPESVALLKKKMVGADGYMISSPEYNSSMPGGLKNAIDWVSRPEKKDKVRLAAFNSKVAFMMSASPGPGGGLRGIFALRYILSNILSVVVPEYFRVANAGSAFGADGELLNVEQTVELGDKLDMFIDMATRLRK